MKILFFRYSSYGLIVLLWYFIIVYQGLFPKVYHDFNENSLLVLNLEYLIKFYYFMVSKLDNSLDSESLESYIFFIHH